MNLLNRYQTSPAAVKTLIFTPDAGDLMTLTYLPATFVIAAGVATVTTTGAHQLSVGDLVSLEATNTTGRLVKAVVDTVISANEFTVLIESDWHPGADGPETGGVFGHYFYRAATFFGMKADGTMNPDTIKLGRDPDGYLLPIHLLPNDPANPYAVSDLAPTDRHLDLCDWYSYGVTDCSIVVVLYL